MIDVIQVRGDGPWMIPVKGPRCQRVRFPSHWKIVQSGAQPQDCVTLCYKNILGNTVRTVLDVPQMREIYDALKVCFDG